MFPKTGVRFVAEDANKFIRQSREAQGSLLDFQRTAASAGTQSMGLESATGDASAAMGTLSSVSLGTVAALGAVVAVVGGAAMAIKGMVSQAISATASYEMLTMSMSSLVAKEIRAEDATLDMEAALDLATERSEELLGWIEQLAIKSPFDSQGVAMAFKTGLTYGFTSEQAQKLTETLVNFATATGQTSAVVQQLAFPLGQIKNTGKALTQDLRQLTNAGVDVTGVLREMGKTWADVTAGTVSSEEFIKTFVATLDRDFGGAAARSAETINGLTNSIEDLSEIGLRNLFGPSIQAMVPLLGSFVAKIQEFMPAAQSFGEGLGYLVSEIKDVFMPSINEGAEGAVDSWNQMHQEMAEETEGTTNQMFDWGAGLVLSYAEGMASAMSYVLDVLTSIGNAIASWLMPGSPPKLLPKIDDWGTSAMNQFLIGFKRADFGIFNEISKTIEQSMRQGAGEDDVMLVPGILGMRTRVARLVDSLKNGTYSTELLDDATAGLDATTKQYVADLVAVQQAQDKVNKINEKYAQILSPINDELQAIAERRAQIQQSQRLDELSAILADENAPALAKELALMELREMELRNMANVVQEAGGEEISSAMTELQMAEEKLAATKELLSAQRDNNKLIKEQMALLKKLEDAMGKAAGAMGKAAGKLGDLAAKLGEGLDFGIETGENPFAAFEERLLALKENMGGVFDPVKAKINTLRQAWGPVISEWDRRWEMSWGDGGVYQTLWNRFSGWLTDSWETSWGDGGVYQTIWDTFSGWYTEAWQKIFGIESSPSKTYGEFFDFLEMAWVGSWGEGGIYRTTWDEFSSWFSGVWQGAWGEGGLYRTIFGNAVDWTVSYWKLGWEQMKTSINNIILGINLAYNMLVQYTQILWARLTQWWTSIKMSVTQIFFEAIELLKEMWEDLQFFFSERLPLLVTYLSERWTEIKDTIEEMWNEMFMIIMEKIGGAYEIVVEKVDAMKEYLHGQVTEWYDAGANMVQGLINGITSMIADAMAAAVEVGSSIKGAFQGVLGMNSPSRVFMGYGQNIVDGLRIGMADAISVAPQVNIPQTAVSPAMIASNTTYNNFNMGGNNINNGMDMAVMSAMMENTIVSALQLG